MAMGEILIWIGWSLIAIWAVFFILALCALAFLDARPADLEFDEDAFLDAEPNFTRLEG